ncbi:type II secretion system F family protein [Halomonas sp. CUBES01]|uniref:type II secretion system F family protein n=1 Tax=Halomonas sp. CUBES01 TaxID=2897340 RepID=UPI001E35AE99|nr:type II secretion system F family protein [Halomonas sp. CUBES01]MEC4766140.1 type II secretion system F family protein [Halomonas sp. CUBES01]
MFESALNILVGVMAAASLAMVVAAAISFRRNIEAPDRDFMDPLSWRLKMAWPLIIFVSYYLGRFLTTEYIQRTKILLARSGLSFSLNPEQFFAIKIISAIGVVIFIHTACLVAGLPPNIGLFVIAAGFGYFLPNLKLNELRKKRERDIVRMLPTYLDFITMAVEAGLSLAAALVKATTNGPDGLLRHELERVNRDIRAGAGRIEALEAMASRLDLREITQVVSALAQAEKTGSSVGATMRIQAEQQRIERFQRAEKKAMEAPVKLIFPLVAFIFPTTFIVLGFPIVMRLIHGI